jgi:hypothetical protein
MAIPVRRAATSISQSGTTFNVTIPSAAQVGDTAFIIYAAGQFGPGSTPAGWTLLKQNGVSDISLAILWKVLVAGDPGSSVGLASGSQHTRVFIEVWGNVTTPASKFNASSSNASVPSAPAAVGSVPLYIWAGYDNSGAIPPSSLTAPSGQGWLGSYATSGSTTIDTGIGVWYTNPLAGTTAPGGSPVGGSSYGAITATIVMPAVPDTACILAGSQAGADKTVQIILAGANAAADTTLVWAP